MLVVCCVGVASGFGPSNTARRGEIAKGRGGKEGEEEGGMMDRARDLGS